MELGDVTTDQLEHELQRMESLRRKASSVMVALIAEADRRQVHLGDGCRSTREWVAARLDTDPDDAAALTSLAKTLDDLPHTARRLSEGEVSVARARIISRVARTESELEWLNRLDGMNLAGAERLAARHRRIHRREERRADQDTFFSMQPSLDESWWRLRGGVGPIAGQMISTAIRERADQFPHDSGDRHHRQALALEAICQDSVEPTGDGAGPSITAFVDLDVADRTGGEAGGELVSGPRLGPEALGELLCNGRSRIVGLSGGRPVKTTSTSRTLPPAVRSFVLWRDGGVCRAPGCRSTYRLQPHHIHGWRNGHHPDGLVSLCWYHHHVVVHRRGYRIERSKAAGIYFRAPADSRDPPR